MSWQVTDGIVAALDPNRNMIYYQLGREYTVYRDGEIIKVKALVTWQTHHTLLTHGTQPSPNVCCVCVCVCAGRI